MNETQLIAQDPTMITSLPAPALAHPANVSEPSHAPRRFQGVLLVLALLLSLSVLAGCADSSASADAGDRGSKKGDKDEGATELKDEAVSVAAFPIQRGPIESVLSYSSNLEAERSVEVLAEASRRVTELLVEEGTTVRKGQTLLRLQNDQQESAVEKAESQLAKAAREYQRQEKLFSQELISEQAFSESTYEKEQLEIAVADARRELTYATVAAPISGTITKRMVNLGDQVQVNQHLFDIVDFSSLVARVFVPEKELGRLARGQEARVSTTATSVDIRAAKILRLAPTVDAKSGTVKVTLSIDDKRDLRPGMFVEVQLVAGTDPNALLVPKRALVYDQEQTFVFRVRDGKSAEVASVNSDESTSSESTSGEALIDPASTTVAQEPTKIVERVLVASLLESRDFVKVSEDTLSVGDLIVVAGQAGLKDGAKVKLLDFAEAMETFGTPEAREELRSRQ